jgi:3-hydroxyacyl-[acyl-carrier-protein] dehydratase
MLSRHATPIRVNLRQAPGFLRDKEDNSGVFLTRSRDPWYAARMDPISLGLPHREPFIFVESVVKLEAGLLAECSKTFRRGESFFAGHFPGNAIVPGVLLVEGMAQTAGIAVGGPGKMFLLTAIRSMKFLRPVRPDETIGFRACKMGDTAGLVQCTVEARVGRDLVAEGQIILANVSPSK